MTIQILGPWEFTPEFGDNKKQEPKKQTRVKMHLLSGREELALGANTSYQDLILAAIDEIENKPILQAPDGRREMEKDDLVKVPELKPLFLEIMQEYGKKNNPGGNPGN